MFERQVYIISVINTRRLLVSLSELALRVHFELKYGYYLIGIGMFIEFGIPELYLHNK